MSDYHSDYHDVPPSEFVPDEETPVHAYEGYEYEYDESYGEYSDEQVYAYDSSPVEADVPAEEQVMSEDGIPYVPEDLAPEPAPGIVWSRGRILYAAMVVIFIAVLLIYMLVPVVDHFLNPPPPPILPPPWMA